MVKEQILSIKETAELLNITERHVKRLIQNKKLQIKIELGKKMIFLKSINEYLILRSQKIPDGYTSSKEAAKEIDVDEEVIIGAIYRGELEGIEHRSGWIVENQSLVSWDKTLIDEDLVEMEKAPYTETCLKVKNIAGVHVRPSKDLAKLSRKYGAVKTSFYLFRDKQKAVAHPNNILETLSLEAHCGDYLGVHIEGPFQNKLLKELRKVFNSFSKYEKSEIKPCKIDRRAIKIDMKKSR